jgi:diguanylate cyclase (GGDEF)-like protein
MSRETGIDDRTSIPKLRVEATLFRELLDVSAIPMIGSGLASVLIVVAEWSLEMRPYLIGWVALIYAIIGVRIGLTRRARRALEAKGYDRQRAMRYALTTAFSGVAWGIGGTFVDVDSPLAMVLTITVLNAMVMGGVVTLSTYIPAFLAFALPAILPMIVVLTASGGRVEFIIAIYNLILLGLMIGIALRVNRSLRQTWELTYEKEDLVEALTKAHDGMTVIAGTDGLTGLANRRRFDEVLETEFARLRRSGAPLSLILIDVDHFKNYNDSYGHVAGDECLKKIGAVLDVSLNRAPDTPARYGGEEFAAVLPETEHEGAIAIAERIRAEIAALGIPHRESPTADHVTISLGIITHDCSAVGSPREFVLMADEQLYRAKSEGRNRIACRNRSQIANTALRDA